MRRRRQQQRAFTLIEILIVVGILALLAAVVVPKFFSSGETAKIILTKSQIGRTGNIGAAMDLYQAAMGRYPDSSENGLMALVQPPGDEEDEKKWRQGGPFIANPEGLRDPWGNLFQYAFPGERNDEDMYDLWSYGPDGEDGTEDDIANWLTDEERSELDLG